MAAYDDSKMRRHIEDMIEGALKDQRDQCVKCRGIGRIKYRVLDTADEKFKGSNFVLLKCPDCKGGGLVLRKYHYLQTTKIDAIERNMSDIRNFEGLEVVRPNEREEQEEYLNV